MAEDAAIGTYRLNMCLEGSFPSFHLFVLVNE